MRVAGLGSGDGGCAEAFDFASHGHDVSLVDFESFPEQIEAIAARGGSQSEGDLSGFAPLAYVGHDFERALDDVELVVAVGPAFSAEPFGAACRPLLKSGQTVPSDPEMGVRQGYMSEATSFPGYMKAPGFKGIQAQAQLDHRYLDEDVGSGLVFYHSLGKQLSVPTPVADAVIAVASAADGEGLHARSGADDRVLGHLWLVHGGVHSARGLRRPGVVLTEIHLPRSLQCA